MTKLIVLRVIFLLLIMLYPFKNGSIKFYGTNELNELEYLLNNDHHIFSMENESYNKRELWILRDDAYFVTLNLDNYSTTCGKTNVKLDFFNKKLHCIHFMNIDEADITQCYMPEMRNYKDRNSDTEITVRNDFLQYQISICDSRLNKKISNWIYKWS